MSEQWLSDLTIPQLRALASQNKIKGWATLPSEKLIQLLVPVEDVEQPHPTFNVAGTQTSRVRTYNDEAMRVSMKDDATGQGTIVTLDLLCGVAMLEPTCIERQ
jgi:hypothetical protein